MINLKLAEKQGLSTETILQIERLHTFRDSLHNSIPLLIEAKNRKLTYEVGQMLFKIEEELQTLWGFPINPNYYKYWTTPCCQCPRMENEDRFPTGRYVISGSCWLHSKEKEE
jgi:hypothetical protein